MSRSSHLPAGDLGSVRASRATNRTAAPIQKSTSALVPFETAEVADHATPRRILASPIQAVSGEVWTEFALALKTATLGAISASNALGMFEFKMRRLKDLGLVDGLRNERSPNGRMVWVGEFVHPHTLRGFLSSPRLQYEVFAKSMVDYVSRLRDGRIERPDGGFSRGTTLSGVLAILHRCGPRGLKVLVDPDARFSDTTALFGRANGIF